MHDHSSKLPDPAISDSLSDLLRGLRLDGVEYCRCEMGSPWGLNIPADSAARFHFIGVRACWLRVGDGDWMELSAGDAVLLPRGTAHVLASSPDVGCCLMKGFTVEPVCNDIYDIRAGGDGAASTVFSVRMHFNIDALHPLLRMMPDTIHAAELGSREPAIQYLLNAIEGEVSAQRVGSGGILARLADVLAATIIRSWVEKGCSADTGWVAAVRNPDIGRVLAAIHLDPSHNWTVPSLARLMGASRSGFAERFATVVGETPARYVAHIRMHQARRWLVNDRLRISVVAQRLGYHSEAAFSRAFKRVIGAAPSSFRADATDARTAAGASLFSKVQG